MTPVQITEDRALEIRDEFADWIEGLSPELPDGPGAVSACYTSLSFGEVFALVTEVLAAREAQPVAWQHRGPRGGWITTDERTKWSERPLYATPPALKETTNAA